ncbi:hypothetical protein [Salicibibacter kimchii]|uniref:hypothetical protein n=1 Tax=Salicibibacter kimchii TaxID=2099786 RepID=UPI001358F944|nr:hypothetical protein [Salicibibacter kimchii]
MKSMRTHDPCFIIDTIAEIGTEAGKAYLESKTTKANQNIGMKRGRRAMNMSKKG